MILVVLSFVFVCEGILEVNYPKSNDTQYFTVVPWANSLSNIETPLVFTTIDSDFMNMSLSNMTVIHYYEFSDYGYDSSLNPNLVVDLLRFQKLGVYCVLLVEDGAGCPIGKFPFTFKIPEEVVIPVGWISLEAWSEISTVNNSVLSASLQWDPNEWDPVINGGGYYFGRALSFFFYVFNFSFALYKIILFLKVDISPSIAVMCLGLEIVANLSNMVDVIIHPFLSIYKIPISFLFDTIFAPIQLSSDFLVLFFWLDLTSSVLFRSKTLDKMKIPAIITVTALLSTETILDIIVCLFLSSQWYALISFVSILRFVCYNLVGVAIIILYFFTAYKVLRGSSDIPLKTKQRFLEAAYRILASAIVCVIILLLYILCFLLPFFYFIPLSFLVNYFFSILSLIQISIFVPKSKPKSDTSSNTSQQTKPTVNSLPNAVD